MCLTFMCLEPEPHNHYNGQSEAVWSTKLFLRGGENCCGNQAAREVHLSAAMSEFISSVPTEKALSM